jgi:uncharacterized protein YjbI with pentapeptide repeats
MSMADEEQLTILKQGVEAWNIWRLKTSRLAINIDLSNVDLSDLDLYRVNFFRANLTGARFNGSKLNYANFSIADLNGADFSNARLSAADLSYADLSSANLSHANLGWAILVESILHKTNFAKAKFQATVFCNNDLREALGLENAQFGGRSYLDFDTIYRSKGKIPEAFLRGCGLSDLQIETVKLAQPGLDPAQVNNTAYKIHELYLEEGIHYFSCFISYNSKDETFARQLHDDLQNNGVRCWFAPEDLKIGDQIRPTIDQAIRLRDKLLVIISENSVKSEWVGDEVEAALEEESKNKRLVLFPIRLDDTVMSTRDDWAAKIKRRRHIGDFSNWTDKACYQKAFERLLRDLKATEG